MWERDGITILVRDADINSSEAANGKSPVFLQERHRSRNPNLTEAFDRRPD